MELSQMLLIRSYGVKELSRMRCCTGDNYLPNSPTYHLANLSTNNCK